MAKNRRLFWIITNSCNLACRYCYYNTGLEKRLMRQLNIIQAKAVIKQIPLFFDEVIFTGGEPLLFPKLFELVALCKKRGLKVSILTNGLLLNKTTCKKLVDNKVDSVSISLDSLNPSINNYLRGKTEIVKKGIKELVKTSKHNKIKIQIMQTITKKNISSIRPLVDFCVKNKIILWLDPVEINKSLPYLEELSLTRCNTNEMQLIKKEMDNWAELMKYKSFKDYKNNCLLLMKNKSLDRISCPMGSNHFVLHNDGSVFPCFLRRDLNLGNIYKEKLGTILKNKKLIDNLPQLKQAKCVRLGCVCLTIS